MNEPGEWTDDQEEALKRWAGKDRSDRHPHDLLPGGRKSEGENDSSQKADGPNDVKPEQCSEMRKMFKKNDDLTIKKMADSHFSFHRSTIAEHVFGRRCSHDVAEEPAESPMGNIDPSDFITPEDCEEMRDRYRDLREIVAVKDEYEGKSYGQVYHHLVGRCKCDHGVPDIREMEID